jgi:Rrf2 family protein
MLSRHGILDAQRGIGGGFALAKPASSITLLDVLRATESDIPRIERCPLGIPGHVRLCALHRLLDDQAAQTEHVFETTTIADIISDQSSTGKLCGTSTGAGVPLTRLNKGK